MPILIRCGCLYEIPTGHLLQKVAAGIAAAAFYAPFTRVKTIADSLVRAQRAAAQEKKLIFHIFTISAINLEE